VCLFCFFDDFLIIVTYSCHIYFVKIKQKNRTYVQKIWHKQLILRNCQFIINVRQTKNTVLLSLKTDGIFLAPSKNVIRLAKNEEKL